MVERYGRWIAALIMVALLLAVVILFATVDMDFTGSTMTDIRSAPILSNEKTEEPKSEAAPTQELTTPKPRRPSGD